MAAGLKGKRNLKQASTAAARYRAVTPSRTCKRETSFGIPEMRTTCKTKKKYFASPIVQVKHSSKGPINENLKNKHDRAACTGKEANSEETKN